ncbi:VTT domain-containing protein [Streptomyces sp. NBC_01186]|nr:VTT domain-containing protein [Streptomyces sp. NBC_01775]WSS12786.1 VTT domain-containing protein [Streptomyces sp. NBC_01186]
MEGALWAAYALLVLTTLPPLVPNSALIATAGALAATGRLSLPLVLLAVAGSALAGDLAIHWLGRRTGPRTRAWLSSSARRKAALDWTAARVWRHGVPFLVVVRFLPSGRIAGGLAAGTVGYPARRFLLGAGIAELLWAGYSVGVGYWGGLVLAGTLSGALVGLGASALLAGGAMGVQWAMRRRARRSAAAPADADADADASVDVPADPPTDASPDAYVDANAGAPVGAPAPASPNADAPVDAPAPAPPSADTDAPARAPVPAPVSVPVCVAARAAASVWVPAPARSAVPLRVPAPARRAAGEGPRSAPVRGAGRGPGVVTDGDAVGEGAGAPAAAPDSSAAAVPGSAGDPVTDGVGEPIGFSALHQIRRG